MMLRFLIFTVVIACLVNSAVAARQENAGSPGCALLAALGSLVENLGDLKELNDLQIEMTNKSIAKCDSQTNECDDTEKLLLRLSDSMTRQEIIDSKVKETKGKLETLRGLCLSATEDP